jgi:hypothetical protein
MRGISARQFGDLFQRQREATLGESGRGSAWLERLVRDQEVGGSNPLAPTIVFKHLQTPTHKNQGPNRVRFGPYSDPTLHSIGRCCRVLIDLPSDDFEDLLCPYREV